MLSTICVFSAYIYNVTNLVYFKRETKIGLLCVRISTDFNESYYLVCIHEHRSTIRCSCMSMETDKWTAFKRIDYSRARGVNKCEPERVLFYMCCEVFVRVWTFVNSYQKPLWVVNSVHVVHNEYALVNWRAHTHKEIDFKMQPRETHKKYGCMRKFIWLSHLILSARIVPMRDAPYLYYRFSRAPLLLISFKFFFFDFLLTQPLHFHTNKT